jgi:hypothetical protein
MDIGVGRCTHGVGAEEMTVKDDIGCSEGAAADFPRWDCLSS